MSEDEALQNIKQSLEPKPAESIDKTTELQEKIQLLQDALKAKDATVAAIIEHVDSLTAYVRQIDKNLLDKKQEVIKAEADCFRVLQDLVPEVKKHK